MNRALRAGQILSVLARRSTLVAALCLVLPLGSAYGQPAPELAYDAVAPLRLPPDLYLGEVAGVAVDSRGHIFVYSRTGPKPRSSAPGRPRSTSSPRTAPSSGRSAATST